MNTQGHVSINQHTKSEVPSLTRSKDMIKAQKFKNGSRDPDHAHLRGDLSSVGWHML